MLKHIAVIKRTSIMQSPTVLNDAELIKRSVNGDLTSFSHIVKHYQKDLVNFINAFTKDHDLAQDASQETFIKLYKNLKKIDCNKPLKPWLYTVAKNYCLDTFRKKKRLLPLQDTIPNPGEPLIEKLIRKEEIFALLTALRRLPTKYREALYARFFEELSYQEISKAFRVPLNTIKTNIKRGKALLLVNAQSYV